MGAAGEVFVAPTGTGPSALAAAVFERLGATIEGATTERRTFLDTFDHRLARAGLTAYTVEAGPNDGPDAKGDGVAVAFTVVWGNGHPPRTLTLAAAPRFPSDLPAGWLRDELARVVEVRALLPVATVDVESVPVVLRNDDDKAVARLLVEAAAGVTVARLVPVKGYAKAATRARRALDDLGLAPTRFTLPALLAGVSDEPVASAKKLGVSDPTEPAGLAFVGVLRRLVAVIDANDAGTRADTDIEFLHDYRVAVRRTRSVLRHAKDVLPDELRECFRPELRWLQEVTGPTRDLDVHLVELDVERATLPDASSRALEPLRDLLRARRAEAFEQMLTDLGSSRLTALLSDWRTTLGALADEGLAGEDGAGEADEWGPWPGDAPLPVADVAAARIQRQYKAFRKAAKAIRDDTPDEALHDLRKSGKELRYLLELFGALFADAVETLVKEMKAVQDDLGVFQDVRIQRDVLHDAGEELAAAADTDADADATAVEALAVLLERLDRRQVAARASALKRLATIGAAPIRGQIEGLPGA